MGDATVAEAKAEFKKAVQAGEFIETTNRAPGRAFTTSEMIEHERDTIQVMRAGQNQHAPIASLKTRRHVEQAHSHLSKSQRAAVEQILSSRDQRGRRPRRLRGGRFCANVTRGAKVSYDPRRLHGVTLYRETERGFSAGDRVQFTAPNRERHIANRELGTIEKSDDSGNLQLRLDSGRTVAFNIRDNPHLDYGYALTSHSSQGQTSDRVLVHVDTEQAGEKLVNRRLAYVALSRGRYDAQLYTNDKTHLTEQLSRDVSHRSAMEANRESVSSAHETEVSSTRSQGHEHTQSEGHSISR